MPTVKKTREMLKLEERHQKDIKEILVETLDAQGSQKKAANVLGVTQFTIRYWCMQLGIKQRYFVEEQQDA